MGAGRDVKAVFGLGNPGARYRATRHNVGRLVVSTWAKGMGIAVGGRKFSARTGTGETAGRTVIAALPQTYMNLSGRSVVALRNYYRLSEADIIVVYDDMDLAFGKIRIRTSGGAGGHRGVESIIDYLGTDAFVRLRVGIGRPPDERVDPVEFVLAPFSPEEGEILPEVVARAGRALDTVIADGAKAAMNEFNG
jgi:PTH1 family peptidyl-tRNA hydrolase